MPMQGPQRYPGASTAHWWQTRYPGARMETNVVVWHSTEGTGLYHYQNGAIAPTLTAQPDFSNERIVWYQHFDFDVSSRALVNAGAVATNTLNVAQVEVIGTCDPATHAKWAKQGVKHLYMAELPDWAIRDFAAFATWASEAHGVPLSSGLEFKAYPSSYGTGNGVRMSNATWLNFRGHCGHQHVPSGNVHGDPGAFPMDRILTLAKGGEKPAAPKKDKPVAAKPSVSLKRIIAAARKDPDAPQGHTTHKADVLLVEKALQAEGLLAKAWVDGSFGTKTIAAYTRWQLKLYPGASTRPGGAADGIPGRDSLKRLGSRHGFTVKE